MERMKNEEQGFDQKSILFSLLEFSEKTNKPHKPQLNEESNKQSLGYKLIRASGRKPQLMNC